MKQLFFTLLILFSGTISARTHLSPEKPDSATSLSVVKDSYKLSGKHLAALARKILFKETPQEDMYLYLLRPAVKSKKALPAIVYFTGGGWVNGDVYGQIPNPAWFRDHGIIGIEADYRVKSRHGTSPIECIQDAKSAIRYVRAHIEFAEKFTRLMKEAGNTCELIRVKDADHSCDWPVSNPNFLPTLQRMTDFLKEQRIICNGVRLMKKQPISSL